MNKKAFYIALFLFPLSISYLVKYAVAAEVGKAPFPPTKLTIKSDTVSPPPPVEPPLGNDSLLPGKTIMNFSPPSGWSLVQGQGFESGVGDGEWLNGNVSSVRAHSGTYSARGQYTSDGSSLDWGIGNIGSFTEIYVSFWEYIDSVARFNDEFMYLTLGEQNTQQHIVFDLYYDSQGKFNSTSGMHCIVGEHASGPGAPYVHYGPDRTVITGQWVQHEIHIRPNTPGNSNGFAIWYRNGTRLFGVSNQNLNGSISLSNGYLLVGGVYTKHIWRRSDNSCGSSIGDMQGYERESNWSNCTCPNQCPTNGIVPSFYRYFDDIIVMRR